MRISQRVYAIHILLSSLLLLFLNLETQASSIRDGEQVYKEVCRSCHDTGAANAPKLTDKVDWAQRLKQPYPTLLDHAIKGFKDMPPKGGFNALSEQQVIAAVDYMLIIVTTEVTAPESMAVNIDALTNANNLSPTELLLRQKKGQQEYHQPPNDDSIPNDKYGDAVKYGKRVFTETNKYASRYTRNGLSCSNCHRDAGRRENSAPLWAAFGMYPSYKSKNDRNNSLEDRIQQCFKFSLNGFAPTMDSPEMRALISYMHFLSKGVAIGVELPGRGLPQVVDTGHDPSPSRGGQSYLAYCARCHGQNGKGKEREGGGYISPPVWGFGSYNKAAGFATDSKLAGFIKANMPPGKEWSLSDQEALDIATYINLQVRPWDPRKGVINGLFD